MMKGNTRYAVGLMSMQIIVSVLCVPFLIPALLTGATVERSKLVMKVVLLVFLPLATGLFVNARYQSVAKVTQLVLHKISSILLILAFPLCLAANFEVISSIFRYEVVLVVATYCGLAFAAGFLLGGPDPESRLTLGLGSILRNAGVAMMFATQAFNDPKIVTMIMLIVLVWLPVVPALIFLFRLTIRRIVPAGTRAP
jgi:BASS family bile acid:Na+ symporter